MSVYQRCGHPAPDDQPEHPQLVSSAITIVSVFTSMCLMSLAAHRCHHADGGPDAVLLRRSFHGRQVLCGPAEGSGQGEHIEEMMEARRSSRCSPTSRKALDGFRQLNDKLKGEAPNADQQLRQYHHARYRTAGQYQLCGLLCSGGRGHGRWRCRRHDPEHRDGLPEPEQGFNMPISQVSMQANSVIMALAGAGVSSR